MSTKQEQWIKCNNRGLVLIRQALTTAMKSKRNSMQHWTRRFSMIKHLHQRSVCELPKYFSHPSLSYLGYFLFFFSNLTQKTKTGAAKKELARCIYSSGERASHNICHNRQAACGRCGNWYSTWNHRKIHDCILSACYDTWKWSLSWLPPKCDDVQDHVAVMPLVVNYECLFSFICRNFGIASTSKTNLPYPKLSFVIK